MPQEKIEAPIVGKILRIYVKPGDKVGEGDVICDIESMKMENPILSPVSGTVEEIKVEPGQTVKTGETIAIINYE